MACYLATLIKFQSTLPREERLSGSAQLKTDFKFQSTLPREERPYLDRCASVTHIISIHAPTRGATLNQSFANNTFINFNPRSHERSDADPDLQGGTMTKISIHAPTRGAT